MLEPPLRCGLLRNKPAALSAHPEKTYYSERSYPTPLVPPSPGALAVQVEEIRRCRAQLPAPGTETETVAERRQRQANERVFRYRNEMTYRILDPRFKEVSCFLFYPLMIVASMICGESKRVASSSAQCLAIAKSMARNRSSNQKCLSQ